MVGQEEARAEQAGEGAVSDQWVEQAGEVRDDLCVREGGPGDRLEEAEDDDNVIGNCDCDYVIEWLGRHENSLEWMYASAGEA